MWVLLVLPEVARFAKRACLVHPRRVIDIQMSAKLVHGIFACVARDVIGRKTSCRKHCFAAKICIGKNSSNPTHKPQCGQEKRLGTSLHEINYEAILGDPGADLGQGKVGTGREKSGRKKVRVSSLTFLRPRFFFAHSVFPSPHYLPLGLRGCYKA